MSAHRHESTAAARPAAAVASAAASAAAATSGALAVGKQLQDLQIQQLLAAGDTTTVYRALDTRLGRSVVLKEYLPRALAQRQGSGLVQPLAAHLAAVYGMGLQTFVQEGRVLMNLRHPALVQVLRCWQQDATAYQVMPLVEGATLQHWLAGLGTPPSEVWLRQLLTPLMQALQALHQAGAHHGDVSLHSIRLQFNNRADSYAGQEPRPLLLGFSAACRALALASAGAAPALHSGFGPIEQSDGAIPVRQGGWTDVYALCAVMYAAIAGRPPPPSLLRLARDDMVSARKVGRGRYSPSFLSAIDAGLAVRPHERLHSIEALRQLLDVPADAHVSGAGPSLVAAEFGCATTSPAAPAEASPGRSGTPLPALQPAEPWGSPVANGLWPAVMGLLLLLMALLGALLRD